MRINTALEKWAARQSQSTEPLRTDDGKAPGDSTTFVVSLGSLSGRNLHQVASFEKRSSDGDLDAIVSEHSAYRGPHSHGWGYH